MVSLYLYNHNLVWARGQPQNFLGAVFSIPNINPAVSTLEDNQWHHVVVVANGTNVRIRIDGVSNHVDTNVSFSAFSGMSGGQFYLGAFSDTFSPISNINTRFVGSMDQFVLYNRVLTTNESIALYNYDADGDGLSNRAELTAGTNPFVSDTDPDKDGLSNVQELQLGTNPLNFDSDSDLLPDGWEVNYNLDPKSASGINGTTGNVDNDGLDNLEEYVNGTNPRVADTDSDTVTDGAEVIAGTDPLNNLDKPFNPNDFTGPVISDTNLWPIGNLGVVYTADASVYKLTGEFGDDSSSHSERWQLNVGSKKKVNRQYGVMQPFDLKLNNSKIWELGIQHVATNGPKDNPFYPNYDYNFHTSSYPGFILVDKDPKLQGDFLIIEQNLPANYWNSRRAYLIPTKSSSYSESFSGGDAVGPRYRKIALNGRPLPDDKPEGEEESEIHEEETYIDAFDLGLHHDTSFASIPLAASDLRIEANASVRETTWADRSGLRPSEELTSPFGVA